jgi:hypothetical protein
MRTEVMTVVALLIASGSPVAADPVSWRGSIGPYESTLGLTVYRDREGLNWYVVEVNDRGYTDVRSIGTYHTPFGTNPGIGLRLDHERLRPSALLLSMADNQIPADGGWLDQRTLLIINDRVGGSLITEMYGRLTRSRGYLGAASVMVIDGRGGWEYSFGHVFNLRDRRWGFVQFSYGLLTKRFWREGRLVASRHWFPKPHWEPAGWRTEAGLMISIGINQVMTRLR